MSSGEKKHEPTEQKLKKAREEGQVAKSSIFTQSFQLVGLIIGILLCKNLFWSNPRILLQYEYGFNKVTIALFIQQWLYCLVQSCGVVILSIVIGAFVGEALQVGFQIHLKALHFKADRLNPISLGKKLMTSCKDSWLTLVKFFFSILVTFLFISINFYEIPQMITASPDFLLLKSSRLFFNFLSWIFAIFLFISVIEIFYKKKQFIKDQKMTDQELKDEVKQVEGDPFVKSMQRQLREQLSFSQLSKRVRRSKVIIVRSVEVPA